MKTSSDELALLIGRVTMAANDVNGTIFNLFLSVSQMFKKHELAEAIFFTLRSDASQREITRAAAKVALERTRSDLWSRANALLNKAGTLAGERNAAIHTIWSLELPSEKLKPYFVVHGRLEKDNFVDQFDRLEKDLKSLAQELIALSMDVTLHFSSLQKAP